MQSSANYECKQKRRRSMVAINFNKRLPHTTNIMPLSPCLQSLAIAFRIPIQSNAIVSASSSTLPLRCRPSFSQRASFSTTPISQARNAKGRPKQDPRISPSPIYKSSSTTYISCSNDTLPPPPPPHTAALTILPHARSPALDHPSRCSARTTSRPRAA